MLDDIRRTGVLVHPTSLPAPFGTGDIGESSRDFVDWCVTHDVTLWQVLPLVPPGPGFSPYSTPSAFAGSPWLIDLVALVEGGHLDSSDLDQAPTFDADQLDPGAMIAFRRPLLEKAGARFCASSAGQQHLETFFAANPWAKEHARFFAIRESRDDQSWTQWPEDLRDRTPAGLAQIDVELVDRIRFHGALQFWFDSQWSSLRAYANGRGVRIVGDVPIYVDHDSVEAWTYRDAFQMDKDGACDVISGVPPDPFSDVGQLWGNPLYDWDAQRRDGFQFWVERMRRSLALADVVRIDHFRGLSAYWEVPVGSPDARPGRWRDGPGRDLFVALEKACGSLPIIAEDLGIIDAPVEELRDGVGLPGMKVLQFAFGEDAENAYLPHNHVPWSVVYTGTHDTPTLRGFWESTTDIVRDHIRRYFGVDGHDVVWDLNRCAIASCAMWAVLPLQDVLELGDDARMNRPGLAEGNWCWRVQKGAFEGDAGDRLASLSRLYGRVPPPPK